MSVILFRLDSLKTHTLTFHMLHHVSLVCLFFFFLSLALSCGIHLMCVFVCTSVSLCVAVCVLRSRRRPNTDIRTSIHMCTSSIYARHSDIRKPGL